ncbi:MAG TPA: HAD family phosphatase [Alphaproteobacteria bacterium]|nr:HAD family phosphatase [Alphaproteobacteria bacterium]
MAGAGEQAAGAVDAVVFDLGGVLIDWSPYHLYRKLLPDDEAIAGFLAEIDLYGFLLGVDADKPFEASVRALARRHPERADLVNAFWDRWPETLRGEIAGSVALVEALKAAGHPLYVISNWSAETWHHGRRFNFLEHFDGLVISGQEGIIKPDPRIFEIACTRFALTPGRSLFIDDNAANVQAAASLGFHTHHFRDPATLREALVDLGLLAA